MFRTALLLLLALPSIDSKQLPTDIRWPAKIQDHHLHVAPGGAISAKNPTTSTTLTSGGLQSSVTVQSNEEPILIQKRDGTSEPLDSDKVCSMSNVQWTRL